MPDEQENIEAALAAYLDGELAPPDRAQIERHLTTHPEHRKLLDVLAGQRMALRSLPRESAPIDMSETVQAQLERSVLLDRIEDTTVYSSLRSDRWRQWRAVAAVLLLTAGLSALIYVIFPKGNAPAEFATVKQAEGLKSATVIADEEKATTLPSVATRAAGEMGIGSKELTAVEPTIPSPAADVAIAENRPPTLAAAPAVVAAPMPGAGMRDKDATVETARAGNDGWQSQRAANTAAVAKAGPSGNSNESLLDQRQIADRLRSDAVTNTGDANRVVVLVTTDDPVATRGQVARFFADNRIEFAAVPAEKREPVATTPADVSTQANNSSVAPTSSALTLNKDDEPKAFDSQLNKPKVDLEARQRSVADADGDGYLARRVTRSQLLSLNAQIGQARANQRAEVFDQSAAGQAVGSYGRAATQPATAPAGSPATAPTTAADVVDALYVVQSSAPTSAPATVPVEAPTTRPVP